MTRQFDDGNRNFSAGVTSVLPDGTPQGQTGDAANVHIESVLSNTYQQSLSRLEPFGPGTAAAIGSTGDLSFYRSAIIVISGLAAETVAVNAVLEGVVRNPVTTYTNAGVAAAASALTNGTFFVRLRDTTVDGLNFVKSGAVDNVTILLKAYG